MSRSKVDSKVAPLVGSNNTDIVKGVVAALFTVFLWASWIVTSKLGVSANVSQFDMALIRYGFPGLFFSFFLFRSMALFAKLPKIHIVFMCLGAGLPFFYLGTLGMKFAPAIHAGILIPGSFPLFVSLIAIVFYKETISKQRAFGLLAIFLGVFVLLLPGILKAEDNSIFLGHILFLCASFCWSLFSVSMRVCGVPPLAASGLFSFTAVAMLGLFYVTGIASTDLSLEKILLNKPVYITLLSVQGVLVGLLAGFSFGFAIHRLGAERTAALGSLAPVIATLLAIPVLGESISFITVSAMIIVCVGVLYASGLNFKYFSRKYIPGSKASVVRT